MPGQQIYIYQKNNKLLDAVITAQVAKSTRRPLIYPIQKKGNGNIRLYGDFTGGVDAKYEVKILDSVLDKPSVSAPVFKGAGTGKMSGIEVSGLEAQKISVLCISTGTDTIDAEIEIEGLRFRAKTAGAAGNNIYVVIDDSQLILSETDYSLIKGLSVGDTGLSGQEWDWDTKALQSDLVPSDAHRVAFGKDMVHIYLQYKDYDAGEWKYYFIPQIRYEAKAGEKVYFVTGGRRVTVTDGITSEEFNNIITIADLWQAVKDGSTLIEPVASSIDTARAITSPAIRELAAKTDAYSLPPYRDQGSSEYAGELEGIGVTSQAKTELIEIKCVDNTYIGAEVWDVKGSASGELGQAQSGQLADFGYVNFLIPQQFPDDWGKLKEDWNYKLKYVSRDVGVDPPPICFSMRLGVASKPQALTLEYKKKPPECNCPPATFSKKCLGLEEEGGEIGMAYIVPDLHFWTDVVAERMKEQIVLQGAEYYEGRSSYQANLALKGPLSKMIADYINIFKTLAQRIMNLPEDDTSTLQVMIDEYKQLINSMKIYSLEGSQWHTWDGSNWSPAWTLGHQMYDISYDTALYQTLADRVLNYEKTYGLKKNSIIAAGTCYQDSGDEYYWEVRGNKAYLPAYTDMPYYSTIQQGEEYVNTKEFAFLISTPCGGSLLEGDIIEVSIGELQYEHTYQLGDVTYLPTIAKQNLYLSGGVDGDDTYTWGIAGEIDSFPDYLLDRDNPSQYINSKLRFLIEDGIVPFQIGDQFEFSIEGGHFIWRKDGGAWSSAVDIEKEIQAFDSGLMIGFEFGVSPSFEVDDTWEILCIQDNKASNMLSLLKSLKYSGSGYVTFDMGSQISADALIVDGHNIQSSFVFKTSNVPDFSVVEYQDTITPADLICSLFSAVTARYWRLEFSGDVEIGYCFIGTSMTLSLDADSIRPLRRYQMDRQTGKVPFSLLTYAQKGYTVGYDSFIHNADWEALEEMIAYLKGNNDLPLYFVPNTNYPEDCLRVWVDVDSLEVGSGIDINAPKANRLYSLTLPLVGVQ